MATYINRNFSRGKISNLDGLVANGDTFRKCNFSQSVAHTAICVGITGLSFIDCNLMNCDVPGDAIVEGCQTVQKELCANKHPERVATGELDVEIENCSHVVDTDEIWIDSQLIDTIYHYGDKVID